MLSTGLSATTVECEAVQYVKFDPPNNQACGEYMCDFIDIAGSGYPEDPSATSQCSFCTMDKTNTFLLSVGGKFDEAGRNFELMWVCIAFNGSCTRGKKAYGTQ